VIGILGGGEFDALSRYLPEASRTHPCVHWCPGAPGHGCGHNPGSGAASLGRRPSTIKDLIAAGKLKGTIRFYGTPAEEAVGGKVYMARDGLFKDVDVMLAWHPADRTMADNGTSQAIVDFIVEFKGKTRARRVRPLERTQRRRRGRSLVHGVNLLREHVRPSVRMHYVTVKAGDVPNVVPDYAKVWMWVRDSRGAGVETVLARVRQIADGAGRIADVESVFTVQAGDYEVLANQTGTRALHKNMVTLGPITYTDEEQAFARAIQKTVGIAREGRGGRRAAVPGSGAHRAGRRFHGRRGRELAGADHQPECDDGSVEFSLACLAGGGPPARCPSATRAWSYAAKALAMTAVDLFEDPAMREAIRAEFAGKTTGFVYKPWVPAGPPPIPTP
jgi:aminobenzoyl-glutamate utilization protein B